MSICKNCGAQIQDGMNVCPVCGAAVQNGQMNQYQQPAGGFGIQQQAGGFGMQQPAGGFGMQPMMNGYGNMMPPKKNKTALIACIIAAVAVIALVVVLLVVFVFKKDGKGSGSAGGGGSSSESGSSSYKAAAEKFLDGYSKQNLDAACKAAPSKLRASLKESVLEGEYEDEDEYWEEIRDYYGNDVKITYSYSDSEEWDAQEIAELLDYYYDYSANISECYMVEYEVKYKGSYDYDSEDIALLAIKVDGKWYIAAVDF